MLWLGGYLAQDSLPAASALGDGIGKWGRQRNENLANYNDLNLGGKSAYPQASETNAPPESENGVLASEPPPTPREKRPNILGFYMA